MKQLYFGLLFCCILSQAPAQPDGLQQYDPFFEQQSHLYQDWLDQSRLSQAFKVREVQAFRQGVMLNLEFTTTHPDSVAALWYSAKENFETGRLLSLEEALFLKMLRLMDLQSDQAILQIRSDYRGLGTEYFLKIYTEAGRLQTDQNFSKGYFDKIQLSLATGTASVSDRELNTQNWSRSQVYEHVREFISLEYRENRECPESSPEIDVFLSMKDKLMVSVSGLCREVLSKQRQLLFCRVLERLKQDCTSVKRESLHFEFDFDEKSGRLYCQLDGKYSNDYLLFHGKVQDMDDDFASFLQAYGDQFLKTLKEWIEKQ